MCMFLRGTNQEGCKEQALKSSMENHPHIYILYGMQVHSYRNPVLFTGATRQIAKDSVVLEIGPHSILRSLVRQTRPDLPYVGCMRKGRCGVESLADALGELWKRGVPVHWEATEDTDGPNAVPRCIREALTSWDRTLYDIPVVAADPPAPGQIYHRVYDLGDLSPPTPPTPLSSLSISLSLSTHTPTFSCF